VYAQPRIGLVTPRAFGVPVANATGEVALIGDSHANAWRAAMEVVAERLGLPGVSLSMGGCSFSDALIRASARAALLCHAWGTEVTQWLTAHPEVGIVVVSAKGGRRFFGAVRAGFHRIWRALPPSVHRIYVVRDVPVPVGRREFDCVLRAIERHRAAGTLCAQPRSRALPPDAEATAAGDAQQPRVKLLDFTPFFCERLRCFPVVGGVLVLKDWEHMTREFSASLGPYLLRAVLHVG